MCAFTSLYVQQNETSYSIRIFSMGCQTWYFILNVIICHFSGGSMVMWTTKYCFDFLCVLSYVYCHYVQNYRPTHEKTNIILDQLQKTIF